MKSVMPFVFAVLALTPLALFVMYEEYLPEGISWNRSASLPLGLYWHTRARLPPRLGDVVCVAYQAPVWASDRHYVPEGFLICKKVLGLPGTRIERSKEGIKLCDVAGCRDGGRLIDRDSQGRPVPASPLPPVIPPGSVYLGSLCAPQSFDSRYLGVFAMTDLVRTLHPLIVDTRAGC